MPVLVIWMLALLACGGSSHAEDSFVSPRSDAVEKDDAEWKKLLTPEQYYVLRKQGTERAFSSELLNQKAKGVYTCGGCNLELFSSADKFRSGTGWPSYTRAIADDAVGRRTDGSLGMARTEIVCNRCGGHLGHVFPDGPPPTGERFCVNGDALLFVPGSKK
ncbi:MAG: peptide-methionine (R)-S-oxide reductase MsrB [Myxococcota bacterium]